MALSNKPLKKISPNRTIKKTEFSAKSMKGRNLRDTKTYTKSKIRAIGNSKGVILNNHIIEAAGIDPEADIIISVRKGVINIHQELKTVNTDLLSWEKQFKEASKKGIKPEMDFFNGLVNEFDSNEWS